MISPPHDTPDIAPAATVWLMRRCQQAGCSKPARMIDPPLAWLRDREASPRMADARTAPAAPRKACPSGGRIEPRAHAHDHGRSTRTEQPGEPFAAAA